MFRDNLSVRSSRLRKSSTQAWPLNMEELGFSETSVTTNRRCVRSQRSEDLIYTAVEDCSHASHLLHIHKACTATWHPLCSLCTKRALLRDIPFVPYAQYVHCYVTSRLFLMPKACIATWHPVCSLCPIRALLRDIPFVPYAQYVHCYVTSRLFLMPKACIATWHPFSHLSPINLYHRHHPPYLTGSYNVHNLLSPPTA
jgi:hypothetical protein